MAQEFVGAGWAFPLRTDATGGIALVDPGARDRGEHPADPRHRARRAADAARVRLRASTTTSSRRPTRRPPGDIAYEVRVALDRWEPRIDLARRRGRASTRSSSGTLYIDIHYASRGTNDPRNLVFPFYVIPPHERREAAADDRCPLPNLDDRRFQDLVDDAKRMVQQRCPEWTDHNVSDPGVTLIETFAFMVDQLLYRLNRVPDRLYLTFLDLHRRARCTPRPPRASTSTFWLSAPAAGHRAVPAGHRGAPPSAPRTRRPSSSPPSDLADRAGVLAGGRRTADAHGGSPSTARERCAYGSAFACFAEHAGRPATRCCSACRPRCRAARSRCGSTAGRGRRASTRDYPPLRLGGVDRRAAGPAASWTATAPAG